MTNWRSHVLEPVVTAAIVIGVALTVLIVMVVSSGDIVYLPIAFFLGILYPLIIAVPWVACTATITWLLRRHSPWMSLAAGGCASILVALVALSPTFVGAIASTTGFSPRDSPVLILAIVAVLFVSLVQFFVHVTLRARKRREVRPELG